MGMTPDGESRASFVLFTGPSILSLSSAQKIKWNNRLAACTGWI